MPVIKSTNKAFNAKGRWYADNTIARDESKLIKEAIQKYQRQKDMDSVDYMDNRND